MKILVVSKYFKPYEGGIETVVYENTRYLVKKGHEVTVIASEHKKGLKKEETIEGIKVIRVPTWFNLSGAPINPGVFLEVIKRDFDIAHLHAPNPFNNVLASIALVLKRKPWVVTYHSDIIGRKGLLFGSLFWFYKNIIQRYFVLGLAKQVMPTSPQYIKISDTLPFIRKSKITVIPNGVDLSKFKPSKSKRKQNEVFFVGRLIYYKGLEVLLKAMKKVIEEIPEAHLNIAGSGKLREELEKLTKKLKLEKNVSFLGRISNEEMKKRFNESTVFILPSIHKSEAFGIVILEAMASGCPVITTDISGTVYAAGKAGIIVKNKSIEELAKAIIKVLKSKRLQEKMSKQGLEHVKKFQWKNIAEMTEKVYKKVLKK